MIDRAGLPAIGVAAAPAAVAALAFRPFGAWAAAYGTVPHVLASAGDDGSVRVIRWN